MHAFSSLSQRIAQSAALNVQVIVTCSFTGKQECHCHFWQKFSLSVHLYQWRREEDQSWILGSWGTHGGLQGGCSCTLSSMALIETAVTSSPAALADCTQ